MSYSKGLNLELIIADLFRRNGYTVIHNLKKKGKSGVEHQIDVYAEYKAPLHTSAIVIEAKSYEEPIDKDKIMKFVQIVDDLDVDRGIFVTTSDYVASAVMTASQYSNIELWNREKIAKLVGELQLSSSASTDQQTKGIEGKIRTVAAAISYDQVKQYASEQIKKKSKGGFLGAGKIVEEVKSIKLMLYPYYDLGVKATVQHTEKTGLIRSSTVEKIIPCKVSVDAITAGIVDVTDKGISYRFALPEITEEEARLLRIFRSGFEMKNALGLGLGDAKTKRLVNGLVARGILKASTTKPIRYTLTREYPEDPSELNSIREVYQLVDFIEGSASVIDPKIQPAQISKVIESYLNAKVEEIELMYYPYYEIWYGREDGSSRVEVLDGISGTLSKRTASMLT